MSGRAQFPMHLWKLNDIYIFHFSNLIGKILIFLNWYLSDCQRSWVYFQIFISFLHFFSGILTICILWSFYHQVAQFFYWFIDAFYFILRLRVYIQCIYVWICILNSRLSIIYFCTCYEMETQICFFQIISKSS